MSPQGAVRAMVGGKSYKKSQFNRAVKAQRQPGSAFKPFVYLTAIDRGFRPDTIVDDRKFCVKNWCPENYNKRYAGPVSLKSALAQSLNSVAVRLAVEAGPERVVATAKRLGIRSKLNANASIALGTSEVNLLELTAAYAPFANGGNGVFAHVIKRIVTTDGRILYERQGSGPGRVLNDHEVGAMNTLMTETVTRGTGKRAKIKGHIVAGKTGTTQDYRDAWFLGYSAYYVAGVWVGNDDSSPTRRTTGGGLPASIWHDVMGPAHAGLSAQVLPGGIAREDPGFDLSPFEIDEDLLRRGRDDLTGFFKSIFGASAEDRQKPETRSARRLREKRAERRRERQRQREENR
jgi:penicillin-binding protein 1A